MASPSQTEKNRRSLSVESLGAHLGRRTVSGAAIAIGAQLIRMAVQLVSAAIMARLLAPQDFGLVAMAATITGFVALFSDLGLSAATVQRKDIDQDTVSALFLINLGTGSLLMLAAFATAPVAAWVFGDDRVVWLVAALALQIPIAAAAAQHGAILQRGMRWTAIQWSAIAAQLAGAAVGILLAWKTDLGYWALVAQGLTSAVAASVLLWILCPWRPTAIAAWTSVPSALGFGLNLTGFTLVNYFHRQLDTVLIGWRWGATELGYYTRAYNLFLLPLSVINGPLSSAVIPALSRLQGEPARWRTAFLEALSGATLVGSGMTAMLIAGAHPLVAVLFGPGWSPSAEIFTALAISMFAATPMNALGWIYISLGRTRRMFAWSLIATPLYVASFIVALPWGAQGVAGAYSAVFCASVLPGLAFAAKGTPVGLLSMLRVVAPPIVAGALSAVIGLLVWRGDKFGNPFAELVMTSAVVGFVYGALALLLLLVDPAYGDLKQRTLLIVQRRQPAPARAP